MKLYEAGARRESRRSRTQSAYGLRLSYALLSRKGLQVQPPQQIGHCSEGALLHFNVPRPDVPDFRLFTPGMFQTVGRDIWVLCNVRHVRAARPQIVRERIQSDRASCT